MDKMQALQAFWQSFSIPAYDENTVPDDAEMPYITSIGNNLSLSAYLWYHSTSWEEITKKAEEISESIDTACPPAFKIDGGRIYITRGSPFAQRMSDPIINVRRIRLNVSVEFFTNH